MEVYRIVKAQYADGLYASGRAGRWNEMDQWVLYTASSRALATLELLVHQSNIHGTAAYKVLIIDVPGVPHTIPKEELPDQWRSLSAYAQLQAIGSRWYQSQKSLLLSIPSAVIPQERNILINTRHADFEQVKLLATEDYFWDDRLSG